MREKCPNTEFFLVCIFLYSDWKSTHITQRHTHSPFKYIRWWVLWKQLTIFAKHSILDVWQECEYASDHLLQNLITQTTITVTKCIFSTFCQRWFKKIYHSNYIHIRLFWAIFTDSKYVFIYISIRIFIKISMSSIQLNWAKFS